MKLLRNVFRRKLRAFLTIFGITIGVFTLVVMGSMAEKINLLVSGGTQYYADKVIVLDASSTSMSFATPLPVSKIDEIGKVAGVQAASAGITMLLAKEQSALGMDMIIGSDLRGSQYESIKITYAKGRALRADDRGKVVFGADIAKKLAAEVGKTVMLRGVPFEVVGIMDSTLTAPDSSAMISLPDAQALFIEDLPELVQKQLQADAIATEITVYAKKGVDPDELAKTIQAQVPGVRADGPKAFQETVVSSTKILNSIVFGVALISLLVGGLSVVNTMTMSVFERTREIGIRKAIGASHRQIIGQFLGESAAIGLLGGVAGLVLGFVATLVLNAAFDSAGMALFLLTSRLAIGAVLFAVALGLVSGLYPSWHAARLNPVAALRYE
jgi:putative ABC transport system permease protein